MSKFDNMANAINKRLINIAKTYGINHPAYQNYANKVKMEHLPTRKTAEGVLQLTRTNKPSEYQQARVEDLYKRGATVTKIRQRYRKKHPEIKGRAAIDKEIKAALTRQEEINETLDKIYKYIDEGIAPTDLVDKYNHFREHDTTNHEIDQLIDEAAEFDAMLDDIKADLAAVQSRDYIPEDIEQDVWEIASGRLSVEEIKEARERIKHYLEYGEGADDEEDD